MKRQRHIAILFLLLAAIFLPAYAQDKVYHAPDGGVRAVITAVGKKGSAENRIEIRHAKGTLLQRKSFASAGGAHGVSINQAAWTTDGNYFVFNTESAGGHQPWHKTTYFYSRRANRFYCLDDFIGPVTSDFELTEQHTIKTTRFNFSINQEKEPITVRLSKLHR